VFLDEFGTNLGMGRWYGWAPVGERAFGSAPGNPRPNITLELGLRLSGIVAPMVFVGAMNGPTFLTYVQNELCPWLRPGDVVLADRLSSHNVTGVREAIEATGARYWPLPPYSPDFSPIEQCGSKVKEAIRAAAPRTIQAAYDATAEAIGTVTRQDIRGYFEHAGYIPPRPIRRRLRPGARYFPRRPPPLLFARGRPQGNRRIRKRAPPEPNPL
jgi:transposase